MKVLYGFFIFSMKRFLISHKEGSFDDRSNKRQHRNWRETENETKFKKNKKLACSDECLCNYTN